MSIKSKTVQLSALALLALGAGGAMAYGPMHYGMGGGAAMGALCPVGQNAAGRSFHGYRGVPLEAVLKVRAERNAQTETALQLKGRQQVLFENYTKAIDKSIKARFEQRDRYQTPPKDRQDVLDRRAAYAQVHSQSLSDIAKARSALRASLNEGQRITLDAMESQSQVRCGGMPGARGMYPGMRGGAGSYYYHGMRGQRWMQGNPDAAQQEVSPKVQP